MKEAPVFDLAALATTDAAHNRRTLGGKAAHLGALVRAGLAVPPGFAIGCDALARVLAGDRELHGALLERARALGETLAVRSSSTIEDGPQGAAPGLFESVLDVAPEGLLAALETVAASSESAAARAYGEMTGAGIGRMAAVVQRQVHGARGVLYTRAPGRPDGDAVAIEDEHGYRELLRSGEALEGDRASDDDRALIAAGLRAERAIAADTGADVEWVREPDGTLWLVQARPIVHPAAAFRPPPPSVLAFAAAEPALRWRWDVTHNPDPLSPAQAGLVEHVDARAIIGVRMRVVGGYLYTADAPPRVRRDEPRLEWLRRYEELVAHHANQLAPRVAASRVALIELLDDEALAARLLGDSSRARLDHAITRTARGELPFERLLALAGDMAPAWDVAAPTFAETPEVLRAAVEAERERPGAMDADALAAAEAEAEARVAPGQRAELARILAAARRGRDLGEADDRIFFRAQALARAALLDIARDAGLQPAGDIFFVPFEDAIAHAEGRHRLAPARARELAARGRATQAEQARWTMPLAIGAGARESPRPRGREVWTGHGIGGRAVGTVCRLADLGEAPALGPDAILVVPAITPPMTVWLRGARAVVSQHDGLLSHGAAMARQLGLPCVVGCTGAWLDLRSGDRVMVLGDAGLVVRART